MTFRFYIIDVDSEVTGTDNEEIAKEAATDDMNVVIETQQDEIIGPNGDRSDIPRANWG